MQNNMCVANRKQRGSSMVEVLVTMVIIATGLLGIASMQMVSLKNANSSYQRYVASLYAYDMMERMRSNPAGVAAGSYDNISVNGSETQVSCTNACSTSNIASFDAYQWGDQLQTNLPSGAGRVEATADGYRISVSWSEQDTGADFGTSAGTVDTQTITLEIAL